MPYGRLSSNGLMLQPDIHRSARKHYVKDHLDDEDLYYAFDHALSSCPLDDERMIHIDGSFLASMSPEECWSLWSLFSTTAMNC